MATEAMTILAVNNCFHVVLESVSVLNNVVLESTFTTPRPSHTFLLVKALAPPGPIIWIKPPCYVCTVRI